MLIVDDEKDCRELVELMLMQCGAWTITAASTAEALEKFRENAFDLIISDIGMPNKDGYALIEEIRALDETRGGKIPAIALTAYARAEDRIRALRAGFQMHIPKPVENYELLLVVSKLTGRKVKYI